MPDSRRIPPRQVLGSDSSQSWAVSIRARRRNVAGFTLVELLTVIAVLALLLGLVVSAVGPARAFSQRVNCLNNLRELGMATQVYVSAHDKYPRIWDGDKGWMDMLKPYLGNKPKLCQCPSDQDKAIVKGVVLSYGMNTSRFQDQAHCFWYTVKSFDVRHPSQVILLADCVTGKFYCGIDPPPFKHPVTNVAYRHLNGTFNAVYCDGHADSRTETTQSDWDAAQ